MLLLPIGRVKLFVLPWAGLSPLGLARTRATLLGRIARARALHDLSHYYPSLP